MFVSCLDNHCMYPLYYTGIVFHYWEEEQEISVIPSVLSRLESRLHMDQLGGVSIWNIVGGVQVSLWSHDSVLQIAAPPSSHSIMTANKHELCVSLMENTSFNNLILYYYVDSSILVYV